MSTLSGALVCVAVRNTPYTGLGWRDFWEEEWATLQAAYDRLLEPLAEGETGPQQPLLDLRIILLHLATGGDVDFVLNPYTGELEPPYESAVGPGAGDFVEYVRAPNFPFTILHSSSLLPRKRGSVPNTWTYTLLFDDRAEPGDTSNAYVPRFGHPPRDFLICVDTGIANILDWPARGAVALGLSNDTRKPLAPDSPGFVVDNQSYKNDMLGEAVRAVRDHYGTATEISEFSHTGYVVETENESEPVAVQKRDSALGALARMLDRVAVLNGL